MPFTWRVGRGILPVFAFSAAKCGFADCGSSLRAAKHGLAVLNPLSFDVCSVTCVDQQLVDAAVARVLVSPSSPE